MTKPGVKELLALLDALKNAVRDFAAREEKLNRDFEGRSAAASRQGDEAAGARASRLAAAVDAENAAYGSAQTRLETHFEHRATRIAEAHASMRKRVMDGIALQHEEIKEKINSDTRAAAQRRDEALDATVVALENFRARASDAAAAVDKLTRRARRAFGGYGAFKRRLASGEHLPEPGPTGDEKSLLEEFERWKKRAEADLERFSTFIPPKIFRFLRPWLVFLLLVAAVVGLAALQRGATAAISRPVAGCALAAPVVLLLIYFDSRRRGAPLAAAIAAGLARMRQFLEAASHAAELTWQRDQERIKAEFEATVQGINREWRNAVRGAMGLRDTRPAEVDRRAANIKRKYQARRSASFERLSASHAGALAALHGQAREDAARFAADQAAKMQSLDRETQSRWRTLEEEWRNTILPVFERLRSASAETEKMFPEWEPAFWGNWTPPGDFPDVARFGRLEIDIKQFVETAPKDKRLAFPEEKVSAPLMLAFPREGSILFETTKGGENEAVAAINNVIFRLLAAMPPGKASFTIFDPVGLGQNFAALMHLADYEESYINSRIWTQTSQFEEKLAELTEHMEKVIQMYLRNEYPTIAEYNAQAGTIAEKYHFLVVASFPVNFSDTAARRLRNIAANGARCGVYTLLHWDQRQPPPNEFVPDELRENAVRISRGEDRFYLADCHPAGIKLILDKPPSPEFATQLLHDIGRASGDATRVEVPFKEVTPPEGQMWSEETVEELRVPIGRSGAAKFQYLEIGKGTRQHALIAGKTGSGKSTLFHVIITNLALWCGPDQVEFYLVDFKKGVEFKCYASRHLPHARVVAIESDRAFGLSVLQRVDEELRRRGDLFRQAGVQDLAGYKRAGGTEPMPRALLMIDEFQEFFTEEDRVSQSAAVLLDRIVRQGRAFGIHVLLGSQTLGGAYTLARATIGQMVIRIALQCNEADAYLIMDQDNPAPRLLSRPGEGIYNDAAGALEGNSPFQAVWLPEGVRDDWLAKIRARADEKQFPGPFIFEGNAAADVRENQDLRDVLGSAPAEAPVRSRIWIGAPNAIKGPTEATFQRQSGANLLIAGQSEERSLTILAVALVSLAAQFPKGAARFVVLDSAPPGFPEREFIERVGRAVPHEVVFGSNAGLAEIMAALADDLKKRSASQAPAPEIFLLINGLQNFKKLRQEDEFGFSSGGGEMKPDAVLQTLISDGPANGIHILAACDTYNNATRFLGRKTLAEFEMRVLFQMSASDSAGLIDSPEAGSLGLHRAIYYNDREGYTEIFRPYGRPAADWIEKAERMMAGKGK